MKFSVFVIVAWLFISGCARQKADLLIYNARIYTVDANFSTAEALAVKDGKIIELGTSKELQDKYQATEETDAQGQFIYPGFIDAHSHFSGYGLGLQTVNLIETKSWEEVLAKLQA